MPRYYFILTLAKRRYNYFLNFRRKESISCQVALRMYRVALGRNKVISMGPISFFSEAGIIPAINFRSSTFTEQL